MKVLICVLALAATSSQAQTVVRYVQNDAEVRVVQNGNVYQYVQTMDTVRVQVQQAKKTRKPSASRPVRPRGPTHE